MNFACPTCHITLQAEADLAGKTVKCPGCSTRIQIPESFGPPAPDAAHEGGSGEETTDEHFEQLPELDISTGHTGPHPSVVSVWIAGACGIGATLFWYLIMFMLPKTEPGVTPGWAGYFRQLFCERGATQYVTTLLTFWCMALLVMKWLKLRQQRRAMLIQALPTDISDEINTSNLKEFHDHVVNFPKPLRNTYIVNRIRKALEFFYVRQNNPEVAQMITSLSEVDAAKANGSYGMVKVFLWAIPIMGFIGTVVGIGAAIAGFGAVFGAGESGDMSQIKEPLLTVLGSMGVAFDTTLLALVFSIMLSFPASSLQGEEDDLVSDVDEYCVDHLLKRLNDGGSSVSAGSDPALLKAFGESMASHQREIMNRFESTQKGMAENLGNQTKQYENVAAAIEKQMQGIDERTEKYERKLDRSLDNQVASLAEGIRNLNAVLSELNGKQVVIQKKGWFRRG
ncbi:MAG: MotA/TolQ/ExbB proton channel family protein [Verrucomicrobiaceae bacterium]|nr:MotA/TolQ/ExbB proton channel family protein [Verrucomicrobiaceae bacterium]